MSKQLAKIFGKPEAWMSAMVAKLELATGTPGEDLRFINECELLMQTKIEELGLDPKDTTAPELYHALQIRYATDSQKLDSALGIEVTTRLSDKVMKAASIVKRSYGHQELWALKHNAARDLLKSQQPRKTMKLLNYRTTDSMLKREAIEGLMLAAAAIESSTWQTDFRRAAAKLDSAKFEMKSVSFVYLDPEKFSEVTYEQDAVCSQLAGSIAIWPNKQLVSCDTLSLALTLSKALPQLGLKNNIDALLHSHPALTWWAGTEHLVYEHDDEVVSMNLRDVAANHSGGDYESRQFQQAKESFWSKLSDRYQQYSGQVAEIIPNMEHELGFAEQEAEVSTPQDLSVETVEI